MAVQTNLDVWRGRSCFNGFLSFDDQQTDTVLQKGRGKTVLVQVVELLFASGDSPLTFRVIDSTTGAIRWQESLEAHRSQHRTMTIPLRLASESDLLVSTTGPSAGSFVAASGVFAS
jgi:hypothetical protein